MGGLNLWLHEGFSSFWQCSWTSNSLVMSVDKATIGGNHRPRGRRGDKKTGQQKLRWADGLQNRTSLNMNTLCRLTGKHITASLFRSWMVSHDQFPTRRERQLKLAVTFSGIATGVARGQSAIPDSEKIANNREREGKNQEKKRKNREDKAKIRKVLSLCPSWHIGLATLLVTFIRDLVVDMCVHGSMVHLFWHTRTSSVWLGLHANFDSVSSKMQVDITVNLKSCRL